MVVEEQKSKPRQAVDNIEDSLGRTFPWLKTSLGGIWTIFWLIIAFTVEAIFFLIPILLVGLGILFIIVVIANGGDLYGLDFLSFGSSKKKKEETR